MNPSQQQYPPPRRTGTYGSHNDELHMNSSAVGSQHGQMSPREYSSTGAPHIKLEQAPASHPPQLQSYTSSSAVPGVLHPGGMGGRPAALSSNTAPTLPTMQQPDYATPSKPPSNMSSLSHNYSRSSPAASYDTGSSYAAYTPTTPNASSSSQFMSPTDNKYAPGSSQRNVSNTPLGLNDIRPRADSSLSDGLPGSMQYELANGQPGTSNYLAPWALYAFDWCKWAPQGNSSGKLALGSYLEDGHNFVSLNDNISTRLDETAGSVLTCAVARFKYSTLKLCPHPPMLWHPALQSTAWTLPRSPRLHTHIR